MLIVVTEISRSVPKIVIPGFRPKHFTITFAGPRNVDRCNGNIAFSTEDLYTGVSPQTFYYSFCWAKECWSLYRGSMHCTSFPYNSATTQVRTLVGNLTNYFQVLFKKVG